MPASYARILRRSAAVTAAAAAVMVAVSAAIAGSKGALGALLGTALVAAFFARFSDATAFNPRLFGVTAIVCILTWSASQVTWSLRLKIPYVEPDGER